MIKEFDSVEFQRKQRAHLSKTISGLTPEEVVNYFKRKSIEREEKSLTQYSPKNVPHVAVSEKKAVYSGKRKK